MSKITVSKTFQFHAAHRIDHHPGECRNLHGHTYTVTIYATGRIQSQGPEQGMVIDFGYIKALYQEHIHGVCDHAFLNDLFEFSTTAENLAAHFLALLRAEDRRIEAVDVSEGPGNIARAEVVS
jgi:6-pyruvoyltetrahydropterin/6-carboxytetrahydropterin synthase